MPRMLALLVAAWMPLAVASAEEPAKSANKERTVEELAEAARKSVVVITVKGRDGKREGIGTGFVVSADGLIATNLHVIGEGRAITVELADQEEMRMNADYSILKAFRGQLERGRIPQVQTEEPCSTNKT